MPIDYNIPFKPISIAVLTISDSRDLSCDISGDTLVSLIEESNHTVALRDICKDDMANIFKILCDWCKMPAIDAIITTGGTGVTGRDVTPEALKMLISKKGGKEIPGFGELFRQLSYQKIGTSTIQSRAMAVVSDGTYIFALPGSKGACKDAWNDILITQLDYRHKPCNFVELMPRLQEV